MIHAIELNEEMRLNLPFKIGRRVPEPGRPGGAAANRARRRRRHLPRYRRVSSRDLQILAIGQLRARFRADRHPVRAFSQCTAHASAQFRRMALRRRACRPNRVATQFYCENA